MAEKELRMTPSFTHHDSIMQAGKDLFSMFQLPDPVMKHCLLAAMLVENSTTLLSGTYGTGKTQLVQLIKRLFFSDGKGDYQFDYETCHQELTAFDVLYQLDLARLQQGVESVTPKAMITARLKFLNEIQRASTSFLNSLLPMLSEHRITYRDFVFEVPPFICIMDRNPQDAGSMAIPEAFMDRIDFSFDIPAIHLEEMLNIIELRRRNEGFHWGGLDELMKPRLTFDQFAEVWTDVKKVDIPYRSQLFCGMITDALRLCRVTERSNAQVDFDLDCANCQYQGEICSHLLKVPGMRITNSILSLSQALAWLESRPEVNESHILTALPWAMSHRVALRPEELRSKASKQTWVREVALQEILLPKLSFWDGAIEAFQKRDIETLAEKAENDLVIKELHDLITRV